MLALCQRFLKTEQDWSIRQRKVPDLGKTSVSLIQGYSIPPARRGSGGIAAASSREGESGDGASRRA